MRSARGTSARSTVTWWLRFLYSRDTSRGNANVPRAGHLRALQGQELHGAWPRPAHGNAGGDGPLHAALRGDFQERGWKAFMAGYVRPSKEDVRREDIRRAG